MSHQSDQLKQWYEARVKPFLAEHVPSRVTDLDGAIDRIQVHERRVREELAICFLGDSGVGKSTLINSLVAGHELVLPAGGIGPLTALAMEVRFGEEAAFEAEYHNARALWQGVIFPLERGHAAQLKESTGRTLDESPPVDVAADQDSEDDGMPLSSSEEDGLRRLESFRKQAQLLLTGNQDSITELPYLLDCLREAAGSRRSWGTALQTEHAQRVQRLRAALAMGKDQRSHRCDRAADPKGFRTDLADHASGFLAPVIKTLHVRWPSELLKPGLVLVDLPGVGVAGDVYKEVTRKWINERAKAVVLVVGRSGLTEAAADLLRTSDFLTRLLFSSDDRTEDPVVLAIAMSHIDDAAEAEYAKDPSRKKAVHLAEQFDRARTLVRSQLRQELQRVWESGDERVRSAQLGVIELLSQEALVFPVSAPQYRRLLAEDDDDRPFIKDETQSGIPAMQQGLFAIVEQRREDARRAGSEAIKAFCRQVISTVELVREQWTGSGHTDQELEQLRADLERVMAPLRKEFLVRQGQFREFLKSTMPERIGALVAEAKESARKEIVKYLRGLRDAHWSTLRASVRREGTFFGARHINLPDDFARKFVEPVAEVWGRAIIQEIRKRTREFASDCERMVVEVAEWCRSQGARVPPRLLDAQIEAIAADIKQIDLAGRDIINSLREQVKNQLGAVIERPIRSKCKRFVEKGDDVGRGVKRRILDLFDELADDTTTAAAESAETLLLKCFKEVEIELRQVLKNLDDPLANASEAVLQAHRGRLERSDLKNRDRVLAAVEVVLGSRPGFCQ